MRFLVVGYGNPTRTDDGAGVYAARQVEKLGLANTEVITSQQLHVELIETFLSYDHVILVDASVGAEDFPPRKIEYASNGVSSTHHLGPEVLASLAKSCYGKEIAMTLFSIRGESFEFSETLSDEARRRADKVVLEIKEFILKQGKQHA